MDAAGHWSAWSEYCAYTSRSNARSFGRRHRDAFYGSQAIRGFVGMDLTHESAPDVTTLLKFRRLLEKHNLTCRNFDEVNEHLVSKGLMMREGTIVDATLIAVPRSTKNRDEKRDPEMHQSKKGKNWFFGVKAHIGVDAKSALAHTLVTTAGSVCGMTQSMSCCTVIKRWCVPQHAKTRLIAALNREQ